METKTVNLRDLPEELVRRAKACAAIHGLTLKDFVRCNFACCGKGYTSHGHSRSIDRFPKPKEGKKKKVIQKPDNAPDLADFQITPLPTQDRRAISPETRV